MVKDADPDVTIFKPSTRTSVRDGVLELRRHSDAPLVLVGWPGDELDLPTALDSGADNYLEDPVGTTQLAACAVALLRRAAIDREGESDVVRGPLVIRRSAGEVSLNGRLLKLSRTEFELLLLLVVSEGHVSERALNNLIDTEHRHVSLDEHIARVRRHLGDDPNVPGWITRVESGGYRFIGPPAGR